jgi:hypothetical protein
MLDKFIDCTAHGSTRVAWEQRLSIYSATQGSHLGPDSQRQGQARAHSQGPSVDPKAWTAQEQRSCFACAAKPGTGVVWREEWMGDVWVDEEGGGPWTWRGETLRLVWYDALVGSRLLEGLRARDYLLQYRAQPCPKCPAACAQAPSVAPVASGGLRDYGPTSGARDVLTLLPSVAKPDGVVHYSPPQPST